MSSPDPSLPPFTVIIPARLAATRLPDKPLLKVGGEAILLRVLRQAEASGAARVIAAVECPTLEAAVKEWGYPAVITGTQDSGSHRVGAAAALLDLPEATPIINVQGDEPFIEPENIRLTARLLIDNDDCACATLCRPPRSAEEYYAPDAVKVVRDKDGRAHYFSRAPLPFQRDGGGVPESASIHIGVYGYRRRYLQKFLTLPPAPTEDAEKLEQLRILWHGGKIIVGDCQSNSFGIDTEDDLQRARALTLARGDG